MIDENFFLKKFCIFADHDFRKEKYPYPPNEHTRLYRTRISERTIPDDHPFHYKKSERSEYEYFYDFFSFGFLSHESTPSSEDIIECQEKNIHPYCSEKFPERCSGDNHRINQIFSRTDKKDSPKNEEKIFFHRDLKIDRVYVFPDFCTGS